MTAPSGYCIFDGNGGTVAAARPDAACENVGGGLYFQDDAVNPPLSHQHPAAADWHQMERQIGRLGSVAPYAKVAVTAGTTPTVTHLLSLTTNVTIGQITVNRATVGQYSFTFPTTAMPSAVFPPECGVTGTVANTICVSQASNVVTSYLRTSGGTLTDSGSFWFGIYGL